jgi:hypothetical protein
MTHKKEDPELNKKLDEIVSYENSKPLTRAQIKEDKKIRNLVSAPNVIITTKEKTPTSKRVTMTRKPLKINPDKCQSGKPGSEPKKICPHCGEYMYKQSSRCYVDHKPSWVPTSWLCRRCGKMLLDMEGFKAVKI